VIMKGITIVACCLFGLLQVVAAQSHTGKKPYTITDSKVDDNTFQGWRLYKEVNCGLCHGDSGQGGAAPSIAQALKFISEEQFIASVTRGKGLMPPYISDPRVMDNIGKFYSYLKARSDGALGEGEPKKQ
jgi:mono/diheme cytochrome c family protein